MNGTFFSRCCAILAMAALGMTAAQAQSPAPQGTPTEAPAKAAAPEVVTRLGSAILEEYHKGAPEQRTTVYRTGRTKQDKTPAANPGHEKP